MSLTLSVSGQKKALAENFHSLKNKINTCSTPGEVQYPDILATINVSWFGWQGWCFIAARSSVANASRQSFGALSVVTSSGNKL